MTTTPQAALLPINYFDVQQAAETYGLDYNKLGCAVRDILAKLQATQELVQAGSASHLDGCKSIMDSIAVSSSVIEHNKQEPVQSVPEAMKVVTEAMRSDPDYAWSWHCNVAMASVDEGMGHYEANQAAARFMRLLAGVDTTKHQGFPEAPEQEPAQAGELPALPHDGWPARFRCDSCDGNGEIGELISMGHFQPPERQTCPDCGGRGWSDEGPAFNADHMRDYARAALSARKPLTDEQHAEQLHDGDWYWVSYAGLGKTYRAAALYKANVDCFYSFEFSGIPAREVQVHSFVGIGLEVKP